MKPSALLTIALIVLCLGLGTGIFLQGKTITTLRADRERLQANGNDHPPAETTPAEPTPASPAPPSSELLRLRSQVSQLTQRQRELANVSAENEQLRGQLASRASTAGGPALPPGYLRKSQAQWVGLGSPEATIQSFLWAIEHRDVARLLHTMTPQAGTEFKKQFGDSFDRFFQGAGAMPGARIVQQSQMPDGTIQVNLEIVPGQRSSEVVIFVLINNEWRMNFR